MLAVLSSLHSVHLGAYSLFFFFFLFYFIFLFMHCMRSHQLLLSVSFSFFSLISFFLLFTWPFAIIIATLKGHFGNTHTHFQTSVSRIAVMF